MDSQAGAHDATGKVLRVHPLTGLVGVASIVVLFASNWLLMGHSNRLQDSLKARAAAMAPVEGETVPPLVGYTLAGDTVTLDYGSDPRQTLLLVFSTECSIAEANWPNWDSLIDQIDMSKFRVVYINLARSITPEYTASHRLHDDAVLLARIDPQSAVEYNLSLTPTVVLVDEFATIRKVWLGAVKDDYKADLESTLDVVLGTSS